MVRCPRKGCKGCVLFKDWESKTIKRFIGICDECGLSYRAKPIQSAREFLDGLTELFANTDGLTNEEIREDLEAQGVDVDAALERTMKLLREHGIKVDAERG